MRMDAKEARARAEKVQFSRDTENYKAVINEVEKAVEDGCTSLQTSNKHFFTENTKKVLKKDGYTIMENRDQRDGYSCKLSW